jgi:hypothetical protein
VSELIHCIADYRAGLEAQISLLRHLMALSAREREVTASGGLGTLDEITDAREQVMATLAALEAQQKPIRRALRDRRETVAYLPEFKELSFLHQEAGALAEEILAADNQSLEALREAEIARRCAAESLEKGESTLAAYRRVVMPSPASAKLVNRRG